MNRPDRRAFLAISASSLAALYGGDAALGAPALVASEPSIGARADLANALNLQLFLQNTESLALAGLMSMRPAAGELGDYPAATPLLFPFERNLRTTDARAFLPGPDASQPLVTSSVMTTLGLPPDEFFCHYILKAPREHFVGFELDNPVPRDRQNWPWHSNFDVAGTTISARWTSANLNHPWFAGSRWIPDDDRGGMWRARILDGVRRAASVCADV